MTHLDQDHRPVGLSPAPLEIPTIESLFVDAESLPSPPLAVLQIIRRADDPDVTIAELSKLIELDVALTVQILKIANSALYAPVTPITSIERALTTLGLRSVRLLALSTSLRMLLPESSDGFDTSEIRRRMVVSGSLSRKVCTSLSRVHQDEAFLAGLLSGLGRVVLANKAPVLCRHMVADAGSWPSAETEIGIMGYSTDVVAAGLVRQWGLPDVICEAIDQRARPLSPDGSPLHRSLQIALLAEHVLCSAEPERHLAALYAATELHLGMDVDATNEWLVEAEPLVSAAAEMLQFKLPQNQAYSELVLEATSRLQTLTMEAHATIVEGSRQVEMLSRRNIELQQEASTDALTGLANRGTFDQMFADRVAERLADPANGLGLLVLDLDHFKHINDTYGHSAGDEVLRSIGKVLAQQTRDKDSVARYGGEEFVVTVGAATIEKLELIADRIRTRVADEQITLADGTVVGVTVSIGGALFGEIAQESGQTLLERADGRLYEAKRSGRNRSIVA